jgi:hypothetical protein
VRRHRPRPGALRPASPQLAKSLKPSTAVDMIRGYTKVRTVFYEKRALLTVDLRYPEDRLRVTDEVSVVAAIVTSSRGVAKVSVTLNGAEVFHLRPPRAGSGAIMSLRRSRTCPST